MANIPLDQIPNAPVAQAPTLEDARGSGDNTYRQIRTSIAEGGDSLKQNLGQLAAPGEALQHFGTDVTKIGADIGTATKDIADMERVKAFTQFSTQYGAAKQAVDQQLQNPSTDPSQYAGIVANFNQSYPDTVLKGISPLGLRLLGPDIARTQAKDILDAGVQAHIASNVQLASTNENTMLDNINRAAQSDPNTAKGYLTTAQSLNNAAVSAGIRSKEQGLHYDNVITGTQQVANINANIQANPAWMVDKLQKAADAGSGLPGYPAVSDKDIKTLLLKAQYTQNYQEQGAMAQASAIIDNNKTRPPTLQALQTSTQYQKLTPVQQKAAEASYANDTVYGDDSAKAISAAQDAVNTYDPSIDEAGKKFNALTTQIVGTVPRTERTALMQQLQDTHSGMVQRLQKGEALSDDPDNIPKQIYGEMAAFFKPDIEDSSKSGDEAMAALQKKNNAIAAFKTAWADPKQKGNGTIQDARNIRDSILQQDQAGRGAETLQTPPKPAILPILDPNWWKGKSSSK